MSSQSNKSRHSLNKISNFILEQQNIDIANYTSGHLNENHLWKPQEQRSHQPWDSAIISNNNEDSFLGRSYGKFSLPVPKTPSISKADYNSAMGYEKRNSIKKYSGVKLPPLSASDYNSPRNFSLPMTDKEMALNYLNAPFNKGTTKEEKYKNLMDYENKILKKSDLNTKNILHGTNSIFNLQKKLNEDLIKLENDENLPKEQKSLYKLDIYNNLFSNLIEDTSVFKDILTRIKFEYDEYLFSLLRNQQKINHVNLEEDVNNMKLNENKSYIEELDKQIENIGNLIENLQKSNKDLEAKIIIETDNIKNLKANSERQQIKLINNDQVLEKEDDLNKLLNSPDTLEKRTMTIKDSIIENLEKINNINQKLKNDFVPHVVINNMNQSIKDVEIEINKINEQNKFLREQEKQAENYCKKFLLNYDKTEFAQENVEFLIDFIKKIDLIQPSSFDELETKILDANINIQSSQDNSNTNQINFENFYDDYFS